VLEDIHGSTQLTIEMATRIGSSEDGWISAAYGVLWQRRQLRERLGYPPDDLDTGLLAPPLQRAAEITPGVAQSLGVRLSVHSVMLDA
jgi:hypothetical protein